MTRIYNALQRYQRQLDEANAGAKVQRLVTTKLPRDRMVALYASIEQALPPELPRIVQITSPSGGEGTTTIARDLAVTIASIVGKRVLLITVIRPQAPALPAERPAGLEAVISGAAKHGDVMDPVPGMPLFETTLTSIGPSGKHLFDAPGLEKALSMALSLVDIVLIDTPPVLPDFVGPALARHCGGTVLVVEAERTRAPKVQEAQRRIEAHGGRVIGAVFNKRRWYIPGVIYRHLQ